jgi:hypothetical protein
MVLKTDVHTKSEPGAVATGLFREGSLRRISEILCAKHLNLGIDPVATAPGSDFV